jgi:hypothetical protein
MTATATFGQQTDAKKNQEPAVAPALTKFDLDFPGGTPSELALAVQSALGRPLNAFVPPQFSNVKVPRLKMRGVDAAQLFKALYEASSMDEPVDNPQMPGQFFRASGGFRTQGTATDDSVWYFTGQLPPSNPLPKRFCSYYLLTPYLDRGLTVDDITTAIQTGWKMLGNSDRAELSYHPETKLLIAVCDPDHYQVLDSALHALRDITPQSSAAPSSLKPTADTKSQK